VPAVGESRKRKGKTGGDKNQFLEHCNLRSSDVAPI
jgi:hypothetical protein